LRCTISSAEKRDELSGSEDNPLRHIATDDDNDNDNDNGLASRNRGNIRHGRRADGLGKRPLTTGAERAFFRGSKRLGLANDIRLEDL